MTRLISPLPAQGQYGLVIDANGNSVNVNAILNSLVFQYRWKEGNDLSSMSAISEMNCKTCPQLTVHTSDLYNFSYEIDHKACPLDNLSVATRSCDRLVTTTYEVDANSKIVKTISESINDNVTLAHIDLELITSCATNGKIYYSGYDSTQNFFFVCHNVTNNKWIELKPPAELRNHCITSVGPFVYAIGGFIRNSSLNMNNTIYRYHHQLKHWECVGKLNVGRARTACASYRNRIFIFGGIDGKDHASEGSSSVQVYDTSTQETTDLPNLPIKISEANAVIVNDTAYILTVEGVTIIYSVTTKHTRTLPSFLQSGYYVFAAFLWYGRVRALCGKRRQVDVIFEMDNATETWTKCLQLNVPLDTVMDASVI